MPHNVAANQTQGGISQQRPVGRIVSMVGSKAILMLSSAVLRSNEQDSPRVDIGSLLAIETVDTLVLALVSGVSVPIPDEKNEAEEICIAEMELMGELPKLGTNSLGEFKRGVSVYPAIGDLAFKAGGDILLKAYNFQDKSAARIGTLLFDKDIPAFIQPDKLLGSHFAILGATGTGKSCSVALLLRAILKKNPNAHIILLDPHSEYSRSFGSSAEVVTPRDLNMPFWLLNYEEMVEVLIGQNSHEAEEAEILREFIPLAKKRFYQNKGKDTKVNLRSEQDSGVTFSVDTPVPYRMSDLLSLLDENIGKLDQRKDVSPFKRLKSKIESISQDPRYSFMFGSLTVNDTMADILGRLFRIPVNGKPITIFELTGFPSEVVTVVVSVLCRMTFDFGVWSDGNVPITLVCEEAHRYVPSDKTLGFEPVKRSISRIAKEGRKYSVSLGVVTQRPAEIDPTILAQCNTLFTLRMANDRDQEIVKAAISDAGASLFDILPSLGNGEAIVFGEGVALPARIKLDPLPPQALPKGQTADFTKKWGRDIHDMGFLDEVVCRWREQDIHKPLALNYSEDLNGPTPAPQHDQAAHRAVPGAAATPSDPKAPHPAQPAKKTEPMMPPQPMQMKPVAPQTPDVTAPSPAPQASLQAAQGAQMPDMTRPQPAPPAPAAPPASQVPPQQTQQAAPPSQVPPQQTQQAAPPSQPQAPKPAMRPDVMQAEAHQSAPAAAIPQPPVGAQMPQTPASPPQPASAQVAPAPQVAPPLTSEAEPMPSQTAGFSKRDEQISPAPQAAPGQQETAEPAPDIHEPPALESGVIEQETPPAEPKETPPDAGAPIPGYQRLG